MTRASSQGSDSLSLQEVADDLGVHYMTAYRYVRTGRLDATKSGTEWRVSRTALDRFTHAQATAAQRPRPTRVSADPPADLLAKRLLADDEAGAWKVLDDALAWGRSAEEVVFDVVSPALAQIGDGWRNGSLDVADEHVATGITQRLLGRLGPQFHRRGRKRGTVVMGAPPDDLHGLPIALVADPLRGRGYQVIDLGPNTPASSFGRAAAAASGLIAVTIGATTRRNDDAIRATVRAVRRATDVPVVLGGSAVGSKTKAQSLGADIYAPNGRALLDIVESLHAAR